MNLLVYSYYNVYTGMYILLESLFFTDRYAGSRECLISYHP